MDKITVHDFVPVGDASTSRAAMQLDQGRDLVFACSGSNRWVTPQSAIDPSAFLLRRSKLYQYRFAPPLSTTGRRSINIPEWGQLSPTDDPDNFRLYDLQDFESTDLQTSFTRSEVEPSLRRGKRIQDNGTTVNEPAKRPRLENLSILTLIPQPHFIPAPAVNFQPVDTAKIPPYQKTPPLPVAPYNTAAVNELLSCAFRRAAWLIPVRGSLPWDGTSTAVVLEDTQVASRSPSPCLSVPAPQTRVIAWTPDAVQHLWAFLGTVQQAKHLGPLSLSFHTAPEDACLTNSDDFALDVCRAHLEGVDYIKVYHDAPYSLSLRNILDAYRYEQVNGQLPSRSGANDRKIRILKGARLVLMDERSMAACLIAPEVALVLPLWMAHGSGSGCCLPSSPAMEQQEEAAARYGYGELGTSRVP